MSAYSPDQFPAADISESAIGRAIARVTGEAVFVKDLEGRYRFVNAVALAALGKRSEEVIGCTDEELLGPEQDVAAMMKGDRQVLGEGACVEMEVSFPGSHGTHQTWWSCKTPLRAESGAVIGILGLARDITQRRQHDERLTALLEERQVALDAAEMAWWHFDPRTGVSRVDERYRAIFGVQAHELSSEELFALVHPEDRERAACAVAQALNPDHPQRYHLEIRIIRPDGTLRWIEASGLASFDGEPPNRSASSFVGTVADVTERVQTRLALEESNRKLLLANAQKTQFLTTLSHELRNPLAPMRSALELLRLAGDKAATRERARSVMERQLQHLSRLVDDLLDLARIDRGQISLRKELLDLRQVVAAGAAAMQPIADEQGITLELSLPPTPASMLVDATRLTQCLINVIGNAIKFTPRGGRIHVSVRLEATRIVCEVEDNGIGIPPELLDAVFDPFVQAQPSGAGNQGLGLGLALTRTMVEQHGGQVVASSAGANRGTCLRMAFPRS
jgi:PAS domain S-box-containing protein